MDILWEIVALICFMVLLSLGLFAVYSLVMGGLQNDRKQVVFGIKCLLGAIVTMIVFLIVFFYVFRPGVC